MYNYKTEITEKPDGRCGMKLIETAKTIICDVTCHFKALVLNNFKVKQCVRQFDIIVPNCSAEGYFLKTKQIHYFTNIWSIKLKLLGL